MQTDEVPEEIREMARRMTDRLFEMARKEVFGPATKQELLEKTRTAFFRMHSDFLDIFQKIHPPAVLREGFVLSLTKKDLLSVRQKCDSILLNAKYVRQFMEEWDEIKSNPESSISVEGANDVVNTVKNFVNTVNGYMSMENEPWFGKSQGENDNVYRKTQEAYKEFMNAVSEFFKRTDKEAETVPGIMKAPKVANLLDPNVLKA